MTDSEQNRWVVPLAKTAAVGGLAVVLPIIGALLVVALFLTVLSILSGLLCVWSARLAKRAAQSGGFFMASRLLRN